MYLMFKDMIIQIMLSKRVLVYASMRRMRAQEVVYLVSLLSSLSNVHASFVLERKTKIKEMLIFQIKIECTSLERLVFSNILLVSLYIIFEVKSYEKYSVENLKYYLNIILMNNNNKYTKVI